jgi:uncharacterized membrane protein YbhN (UPF0104 family)
MQYRTSFVLETIAQFVGNVLDFVVVLIFFTRLPTLGGWTLPEIGLLYGLSSVAFGLSDTVIAGFDYAYFGPNMVRLGEFDRVLIRPVNIFLQVLTSQFTLKRFVSGRGHRIGLPAASDRMPRRSLRSTIVGGFSFSSSSLVPVFPSTVNSLK